MHDVMTALVAAGVGVLVGASGVGGVLLISYLALFTELGIHRAAATSLLSLMFTGILGTWLYQRKGSIDWRLVVPVCASAFVASYLGTFVAALSSAATLSATVGAIIAAAGVAMLLPRIAHGPASPPPTGPRGRFTLLAVGVLSGFGSGVSGAGGPVFAVPLMTSLRYATLAAVATSQVLQMVSAFSGSINNVRQGLIDWKVAALVTGFQLLGVVAGARLAHAMPDLWLKRLAGLLCVLAGAMLVLKAL